MNKTKTILCLSLMLLFGSLCCIAEERKSGGTIGLAAGIQRISESDGVVANFSLGKRMLPNLALEWTASITWMAPDTETMVGGFFGLSVDYYLSKDVPSFYLTAGAGYHSGTIGKGDYGQGLWDQGPGFTTGVGYEFSRTVGISFGIRTGKYYQRDTFVGGGVSRAAADLTLRLTFPA